MKTIQLLFYPFGIFIGGVLSAGFITNPMQWLVTTPNHVGSLVESAANTKDIRRPSRGS